MPIFMTDICLHYLVNFSVHLVQKRRRNARSNHDDISWRNAINAKNRTIRYKII